MGACSGRRRILKKCESLFVTLSRRGSGLIFYLVPSGCRQSTTRSFIVPATVTPARAGSWTTRSSGSMSGSAVSVLKNASLAGVAIPRRMAPGETREVQSLPCNTRVYEADSYPPIDRLPPHVWDTVVPDNGSFQERMTPGQVSARPADRGIAQPSIQLPLGYQATDTLTKNSLDQTSRIRDPCHCLPADS